MAHSHCHVAVTVGLGHQSCRFKHFIMRNVKTAYIIVITVYVKSSVPNFSLVLNFGTGGSVYKLLLSPAKTCPLGSFSS